MAEAIALVSFISSIASLIDLSAKVGSRLQEFCTKTSDVPESFRDLSIRLALLTATLKRIQSQAEAGHLPDDAANALKAVIDSISEQISAIQAGLFKILPSDGDSRLDRAVKGLKSLARDDKVQQALEKIHKSVDLLNLHQATRHVDTGERILEELAKLSVTEPASLKSFGVCLGQVPQIAADAFIGRDHELQRLQGLLVPANRPRRQCIASVVGMGGMGKTQLSLAHVRDCADHYSSVFWVNAKDEASLRQSMVDISAIIFYDSNPPVAQSADNEKVEIEKVRRWLSEPGNDGWLLIFDNYDDPHLPGVRSSTGYDIRPFFPTRSQGSIIITSRSTRLSFSTQLRLQKVEDISMSVAILSQRSGRELSLDSKALDLAGRLDGLPLALATTGSYLGRTDISCGEYLELYESAWTDLVGPDAEELLEYEARTMSSTWTVSLKQVRSQNEDAAELLMFLAYLGNQDIWYNLIKAGVSENVPWIGRVTESKIRFQRTMSKLHDYSLVDVVAGSYQVHPCLHDWLVQSLSAPPQAILFITALTCVADSIEGSSSLQYCVTNRRLLEHTDELESPRFNDLWQMFALEEKVIDRADSIAWLLHNWNRFEKAGEMYMRVLAGKEKLLGFDHTSTLDTVNNFGNLYRDQGKLEIAEQMYKRALAGREEALGPNHTSTLETVNNFGNLYRDQGKLEVAEQMYKRALAGREEALGPNHTSTLDAVQNLGAVYTDQGKLVEAEQMYKRALAGKEIALGPDHASTLGTVNNLGILYRDQGKPGEAEQMYKRALAGYEKALGPEHTSTLVTVNNLGLLYAGQGKLETAEQMYNRALAGQEKTLGPEHTSTLITVNNLGLLYVSQGKLEEAEDMYKRALAGWEKVLRPDHASTLGTVNNLGILYRDQGKLEESEQMYQRALAGYEKTLGPQHPSTLETVHNLGLLYTDQGKLEEAEQMYKRALVGWDKSVGPRHPSTLVTVNNLGILYRDQGKLEEAEEMFQRAKQCHVDPATEE